MPRKKARRIMRGETLCKVKKELKEIEEKIEVHCSMKVERDRKGTRKFGLSIDFCWYDENG